MFSSSIPEEQMTEIMHYNYLTILLLHVSCVD